MSQKVIQQQLVEASELLEIVEAYFNCDNLDAVAVNGLQVLLRESRKRIDSAHQQFATNGLAKSAPVEKRIKSKSLASRIQRLPEGEFRTIELDLEPEFEEPSGRSS